jgi:hypothetical protein
MSNIDFTKPVETIDGTSVQIISTEGRGKYPILGYIGNKSQYVTSWMPDGFYLSDKSESGLNLRNKATQPQKVPLELCDVPPGSVIRNGLNNPNRWYAVLSVGHSGLATCEDSLKTFEYLKGSDWQIKRPTDTEWQPCCKEI